MTEFSEASLFWLILSSKYLLLLVKHRKTLGLTQAKATQLGGISATMDAAAVSTHLG